MPPRKNPNPFAHAVRASLRTLEQLEALTGARTLAPFRRLVWEDLGRLAGMSAGPEADRLRRLICARINWCLVDGLRQLTEPPGARHLGQATAPH